MSRLPEQALRPLLLCYLGGYTQDEAARFLGWSLGTLRPAAWARGRDLLRLRMTRASATLSAGLCATLRLPPAATAAVSGGLAQAAARCHRVRGRQGREHHCCCPRAKCPRDLVGPGPLKGLTLLVLTWVVVTAGAGGSAYLAPGAPSLPTCSRPPRAAGGKPGAETVLGDRLGDPLPSVRPRCDSAARASRIPGGDSERGPGPETAGPPPPRGSGGPAPDRYYNGPGRLTLRTLNSPGAMRAQGMRYLSSPDGKACWCRALAGVRLLDAARARRHAPARGRKGSTRGLLSPGRQADSGRGRRWGKTFYEADTGRQLIRGSPLADKGLPSSERRSPCGRPIHGRPVPWPAGATTQESGSVTRRPVPGGPGVRERLRRVKRGLRAGRTNRWPSQARIMPCGCGASPRVRKSVPSDTSRPNRSTITCLTRWLSRRTVRCWPLAPWDGTIHLWDPATGKAFAP